MHGRPVWEPSGRRLGGPLRLVAVAVVLLAASVFVIPPLLVPVGRPPDAAVAPVDRLRLENERVRLRNEARATLLQAFGGAFFLVTAFLTWRQIQVNREGQITDRFTRAIEHLGTEDKLEIRLGGIYALERIASDSAREQGTIMEILTAYVRSHAPRPAVTTPDGHPAEPAPLRVRAPDLQAVMTVLGRRPPVAAELLQLADVDLQRASLPDANLRGANLAGADLSGIELSRADLRGTDLRGAELHHANLTGARLAGARLQHADLWCADLTGADLDGANLDHANLREARLVRGNLDGTDLENANAGEAQLQEATLRGARLKATNLWGANLVGADLRGAGLEASTLVRASLGHAMLDGASLAGAIMDGIDLAGARADRTTTWPAGFDWRSAGVIIEEGSADGRPLGLRRRR